MSDTIATAEYVNMRFGRSGAQVHLGRATSSVPACGTYTKPGSGAQVSAPVTCTKCLKLA